MTKRMRAHKVEDPAVMNLVDTMYASHVPYPNVMCVLRNIAGGAENLHLTERDIQNRRAAHVREERMDDIPKLLAIFRECKTNNPEFFCEFQLDEKNVVKNVFWSHASQQGDYADYSGVVTFDTTYRTNQYSMPLAMFVGFNNKLQNVVFGQALLRDERADTFDWLFRQFRACMVGKDPVGIFTRLSDTLTSIVNHPLRPVEFEEAWAAMLDKYAVHESKVLMNLYDERQMWIGAYFKDILCGMMTSMQRSESVNSAVKHCYCDNSIAIHEFVKSFLELLADNKENEAKEEFNSQAPVVTSTFYGIDNQLSRVYTSVVYKAVVNEKIPEESEFNCECMRIEHTGMFCPHLLCVLTNLQMAHIPSRYIPKRWGHYSKPHAGVDS
ncbi:protein FAR1-RELATED SEQUENCE 5-like [Panicum virgatum]|uniref:protein FAR1-RELATED SEQUENCE 5-like n=1 Tax=Panicum virgatum TaxID=38727 RepID=UPI0019D609CF|nr:protein FAR1-RELATED SEQUENCE 5-like [Panicum virgatum]